MTPANRPLSNMSEHDTESLTLSEPAYPLSLNCGGLSNLPYPTLARSIYGHGARIPVLGGLVRLPLVIARRAVRVTIPHELCIERAKFDALSEHYQMRYEELKQQYDMATARHDELQQNEVTARRAEDNFQLTPEQFVATLYRTVLRRPADPAGLAHWSNIITATGDYTSVLASLVESNEFKALGANLINCPPPSSFTGGAASIRYGTIGALAIDQVGAGLPPGIDIVVPVCNAEKWINAICDGYDALRLRPLFIVEARSSDNSLAILLGRNARAFSARGKRPYVESLLSGIIPYLSSSWILRLDDDELPSYAMLHWIADSISHLQGTSVAFPRFWVHGNTHGVWEISDCRAIGGAWGADHQWRLFRPSAVIPTDAIHTPGFEASGTIAPDEARIYHFDWIVRSYDERLRKIERYEELEKDSGNKFSAYYLPEERDRAIYDFIPLEDNLIETVCERLGPQELCEQKEGRRTQLIDRCGVERYDHIGVKLELPRHLVTPAIRRAFREGYYETLETQLISRFLRPSDTVLELGAAVGFLATWIAQRLTTGRVISYEANPSLIDVAANTFRMNEVNVTLKNAIVIGEAGRETAELFVHQAFWASSQFPNEGTRIEVPARGLSSVLQDVSPDILVVDIEGGEKELFDQVELSGIRHVLVEFHVAVTGRSGVRKVFQRMSELGFTYDPEFSSSYIVTFTPVEGTQTM
jgi:FkbM family methyltransferase